MFFPVPPKRESEEEPQPEPPVKPVRSRAKPTPEATSIWNTKLNALGLLGALLGAGGAVALYASLGLPTDGYRVSRFILVGLVAGAVLGNSLGSLLGRLFKF